MAVSINKKPDSKVRELGAPTRASDGSRKFTAKWSTSDWAKSDKNECRIQGFDVYFDIGCYNLKTGKTKTLNYERRSQDPNRTSWTIDLNNFKLKTGDSKTYKRDTDFYPVNGWWCIRSLTAKIRMYNSKGEGEWVTATREFAQPRKPSISISQNASSGDVTWVVTHDKGLDYRENWSTRVMYEVFDSSRAADARVISSGDTSFGTSNTTHTNSYDVYNRMGKKYNEYTRVTVKAWCRGMWGASDHVQKDFYVSWPMEPEITKYSVSSLESTGLVIVRINTHYSKNEGKTNPVTGVKLCTLVDCEYENEGDIPANAWDSSTETDIVDDGSCTALSSTVAELKPTVGKYTWVRVKAWNQIEGIFYRYSKPMRLKQLETKAPTAQDDAVTIADVKSGDDGRSIVLTLGWDTDDSDGTEISWSENENSWRSTNTPDSYAFKWDDGPATVGGTSYDKTAVVHVMGLTEGTLYHFRARRYIVNSDGETEYGPYCPSGATVTGMPSTSPSSATIMADQFVPSGSSLALSWSYDSEATQRSWEVICGTVTTTTSGGISRSTITDDIKILASGSDATGSCQIPWDVWGPKVSDGAINVAVSVSTGGDPVTSDAKTVNIAEKPTLSVTLDELNDQPYEIGVTCSARSEISVVCTSQYAEQVVPDGTLTQVSGDGVLSMVFSPEWTAGNSGYETTVTLPENLPLIDGCDYTIDIVTTDLSTGMESDTFTGSFSVDYDHKAPEPSDEITIGTYDTTDGTSRTRGATIHLAEPDDAETGDVYDVYRLTQDGAAICARGVPLDATVNDDYAPFGTGVTAYRIACRTPNGCVSWLDYPYSFGDYGVFYREIRVDFGDDSVETDRGVSVSESWKKDFEVREHLDGSRPAYWNESVARSGSVTGASIRVYEPEIDAAFRRLAKYPNVAYVRTSEGVAFSANVDVSISTPKFTAAENVSLSFEEVTSETYMATVPVEVEQ